MRQAIKDELKDQQRPVSSVLDQVQDVTEKGGDVLSKDETKQLDKNAKELRQRWADWRASSRGASGERSLWTPLETGAVQGDGPVTDLI